MPPSGEPLVLTELMGKRPELSQRSIEAMALEVWLDKVAQVVASILTRRGQSHDDSRQKDQEKGHENRELLPRQH